jgi:hypothetical protein
VGNEVEGQGVRKNLILVAIELLGAARHLLTTGEGVIKKKIQELAILCNAKETSPHACKYQPITCML